MIEHAQVLSQDQVMAFLGVLGALVLANLGQLVSWALRAYKRKIKGDLDINAAFKRIREIQKEVDELKQEKKT